MVETSSLKRLHFIFVYLWRNNWLSFFKQKFIPKSVQLRLVLKRVCLPEATQTLRGEGLGACRVTEEGLGFDVKGHTPHLSCPSVRSCIRVGRSVLSANLPESTLHAALTLVPLGHCM